MEMETLFAKALGIVDPWYISGVVFDSEKKRLNIGVDFKKGSLFSYKNEEGEVKDYKAYDTVEKTWRHMNFFEHECYLVVRVPRIKPDCGGIKMIFPPFSGACKGFTLLFESFLLQMCRSMPIHQVGKLMKVSDQRFWRLIECYVQKGRFELDMSHLKQLGIDETSRLRGHDYITLLVDLLACKTLHIEEGKGSETISNFAKQLTQWHEWASESKLPPFEKLAKTIEKHWDGIVMWKKSSINNGILEGLNSLIQAAKRKARGYGKKHFETMAYFLTAKLDSHKFNPYLPTGFV